MSLEDIRNQAKVKLKGICGVYKDCDGAATRLCQGQSYGRPLGIGGVGSGSSFFNNFKALQKIQFKMRLIRSQFEPDTSYQFFDQELSMPIMGASVSGVNSFGGDNVLTERELCRSIVLGCKSIGTIGFRGDTYTYTLDNSYGLDAIAEAEGWGVKIIKPREQSTIIQIIKQAELVGAMAVGIDIDGCGSYMMPKHNQPVYQKTSEDIRELVSATKLPVIIKGIMCEEDALLAADAGATSIVVSNHGGRVLDHTPGTAEVLPKIVDALNGRIMILVDGGIRTGYDVLKMLALGADAVLIGRDLIRAAVGGGIDGVRLQMDYFQKTLAKAMRMTNCSSLEEISSNILS